MNRGFRVAAVLSAIGLLVLKVNGPAEATGKTESTLRAKTLYDSNPDHLWNRLHETLFIRSARDGTEYGFDSLDPLLWHATKHLLDGKSHQQAILALDEFIEKNGEKLIEDPVRRAILQRDLWAVFDWAGMRNRGDEVPVHEAEVKALVPRLAKVMSRLALTKAQIDSLPDNYAAAVATKTFPGKFDPEKPNAAFLPADLFQKEGDWVCVQPAHGLAAPIHAREFGGRSAFLIFINLPNGRAETLAYLEKLNTFPEPWIYDRARLEKTNQFALMDGVMPHRFDEKRRPWVNPDMPQFPVGTKFALVRQTVLIDREARLTPTHLTESVQIRVYRGLDYNRMDGGEQSFFEFVLGRQKLFAGESGGLRISKKSEQEFSTFITHGVDIFELKDPNAQRRLEANSAEKAPLNCMTCHSGVGIHSVLSRSQLFSIPTLHPPEFQASRPDQIRDHAADWKKDQFTWGLLKGYWQQKDGEAH